MLQNLSQKIRDCLQRAEQCAHRSRIERDPSLARDYFDMERGWLSLARSYAFSESLKTFSRHNKKPQEEASEFLSRPVGKAINQSE